MRASIRDLPVLKETIAPGGKTIISKLEIPLEMDPIFTPPMDDTIETKDEGIDTDMALPSLGTPNVEIKVAKSSAKAETTY